MQVNYKFPFPFPSPRGMGSLRLGLHLLEVGAAAEMRRKSIAYSPMELLVVDEQGSPLTWTMLRSIGASIGQLIDFCIQHKDGVAEALTAWQFKEGHSLKQLTFCVTTEDEMRLVLGFSAAETAHVLEVPQDGALITV